MILFLSIQQNMSLASPLINEVMYDAVSGIPRRRRGMGGDL